MTRTAATSLARPVITGLIVLNLFYAACIAFLLVVTLVTDWPWAAMGWDLDGAHRGIPEVLQTVVVIGLVGAALVHVILRKLRAIVDTVRGGDPFVAENAVRLQAIAWGVMVLELLRLPVHALARTVELPGQKIELGSAFSPAAWLAVLLLFVLAGVFAHGARMRADLEGTV